jgi:RNA polymerase sigma factor (sigma-70 family)
MKRSAWQRLSVEEIARNCQQAAAAHHADQPAATDACYELFRRALEDGDQAAWQALHDQYFRLVAHWLGSAAHEDDLIEETLARFWRTLRGVKLARQFGSLGAVLTYLRKCALSVRLDLARRAARERLIELPETLADPAPPVDDVALEDIDRAAVQQALADWLQHHLRDADERLVVTLSYELGLSPAEIAQRHPDRFADAAEVHRVKERLLKRMRRSAELRALFEIIVGKAA